jgi:hypothetical protein
MRRVLLIVLALGLPTSATAAVRAQTISGSITANSGTSLTVSSADRSLTCFVNGSKAQAAIAHWGIGAHAAMACKQNGDRLVLTRLTRLGTKDGTKDGTTTTQPTTTEPTTTEPATPKPEPSEARRDARGKVSALGGGAITVLRPDGSSLVCSLTDGQQRSVQEGAPVGSYVLIVCGGDGDRPALVSLQRIDAPPVTTTTTTPSTTPPPPPPPPATDRRQAIGTVTQLSSDGVTVKPDSGDSLRCRITPASDSQAAAAKLSLGARVGVVCRRDGDSYVLAGSTSA